MYDRFSNLWGKVDEFNKNSWSHLLNVLTQIFYFMFRYFPEELKILMLKIQSKLGKETICEYSGYLMFH